VDAETREIERIRSEYARRAADASRGRQYSALEPAHLFAIQSRERGLLAMLRAEGITSFAGLRVLDLGCGSGDELRRLISYGASPEHLCGLDLIGERLSAARCASPHLALVQGNAAHLPYPEATFDVVLQLTVFSSILDQVLRHRVAAEMLRVLKPAGLIIWYDFWLNPTNRATRGIRPAEIKRLFPGCHHRFRRVTLAPPLARAVVPQSWLAGYLLETLPFLRTHYLAAIRPA